MKILVIENEPLTRANLRDLLELHGHAVIEAENGEEGVRRSQEHPDCVLCDEEVSGQDGFDFVTAIKREPHYRDTPVIFLASQADRANSRRDQAVSNDDYITKPFTERQILDAIEAHATRPKSLRDRVQQLLGERRSGLEANWSHELTAPLNGMLASLELLEAATETIDRSELRELLGFIRGSAERQHQFSRKLIVYYDLEREKANARPRAAVSDARTALVAAVCAARANNPSRADDIVAKAIPGFVPVPGQELICAISELLDNAMRYSSAGQPIGITGFVENGHYCIDIADEGPGLTRDERANLRPFARFKRNGADQSGLGLGLAIAGSVASIAGGQLDLQRRPCGIGLVATLTLPLAAMLD
jgi:signal transduction histidine kinase